MAGQTDRSSTGQTGPIARRPAAARPQHAAPDSGRDLVGIEVGPGSEMVVPVQPAQVPFATTTDDLPRQIKTQAAYRQLITSGVSGDEAAGLISYVIGLAPCTSRWSLKQVNQLLFLRNRYLESDWGRTERRPE